MISQSSRYPNPEGEPLTARWLYYRFHGPRELCSSEYGREGLAPWARALRTRLDQGLMRMVAAETETK